MRGPACSLAMLIGGSRSGWRHARHGAEEIALANLDAGGAKNVISRCQVEIEVGQSEVHEIIRRLRFQPGVGTDRNNDLAIHAGVDRLGVDCLQMAERRLNARAMRGGWTPASRNEAFFA